MKKTISFLLGCALIFCSFATDAFATNVVSDESLLIEMGFPNEIIEIMPDKDKADFIETYLSNTEFIEISTSTMEVDVLSEMSTFAKKTDAELLSAGYSQGQIDQGRHIIENYNNSTDDELISEGLDELEIAALRNALDPSGMNVTKGLISPAKLTFTVASQNLSTTTPNYRINIYFNWSSVYIWDIHTDKIVIAWGGELLQTQISQDIFYYKFGLSDYTDFFQIQSATYQEIAPNAMGIYYFPQTYTIMSPDPNHGSGRIKCGSLSYRLSQTRFDGRDTKVIAYYAHQISSITGSISFTGTAITPGVSIGTGYDTIYAETTIRY